MSQHPEKLAILFADICGSTALYEKIGDDSARKVISRCIETMAGKIPTYQGTLIKTIGDEILCAFPSAEAAFHAACAMQKAVKTPRSIDSIPLDIRIGFHYGEVIKESNDVFGNTVNVASSVVAITRAGQIMTTQAVFDVLPPDLQDKMRPILRAEFRGKHDRPEIYQIILKEEDPLITRTGMHAFRNPSEDNDEMVLRYRGRSISVNNERKSVVLGREETCDLVVQNDLASRQHIRVELRFGKFVIVDQSTNGTYIRSSDGSVAHITREETLLPGNGTISLGKIFAEQSADLVEFLTVPARAQY
jgi:class 3 adenylate cyclase